MSEKTITIKANKYRRLTDEARAARDSLADEVRRNIDAGMSEYTAARAAGVTRMTIRSWLGKATRRPT